MSDPVKISDLGPAPGGAAGDDQIEIERGGGSYQLTVDQLAEYVAPRLCIQEFWGPSPPTGWRILDGAELSRTTYASLFALFGTTAGAGDGTTTFNLPRRDGKRVAVPGGGHETEVVTIPGTDPEETITVHRAVTCWAVRL